jgi:hypothetical protein
VAASAMHFSTDRQKLIIGYPSGIIDIIDEEGNIITITTLRDSPIVADKTIRDIVSEGNNAYLATSFGIVRVNIASNTVIENYRNIGAGGAQLNVHEVAIKGDSLYALSSSGVQSGWLQDNLLDFNDWKLFPETNAGGFTQLIRLNDQLHVLKDGLSLWSFDGQRWSSTDISFPQAITRLVAGDDALALSVSAVYSVFPNPESIITDQAISQASDLVMFDDTYWIADRNSGLIAVNTSTTLVGPTGPISDSPTRLRSFNGRTFAFFGPTPDQYTGVSDQQGYSLFENGSWQTRTFPGFYNITDVAVVGSAQYFSSMGFGIYDEQSGVHLTHSNSTMVEGNSFTGVQISSLTSINNAIWATAYNSPQALYSITPDHSITGYTPSQAGFQYPLHVEVTEQGVLWVIRGAQDGGGIGVYDPVFNQKRSIRTFDGLPSNTVSGLSIDTEDEAWIATSAGIGNYISASFPFNTFGVTVPIFENRFLFEDEIINDVLTDGGDRIWVATNTGVWVLSSNVSEVVHRFTASNSPLPSDVVQGFAYDGTTGEVFIQTDKGIISYRSASSQGADAHASSIRVFPNPVRSGFDGIVGIEGLARNASVKITDVMGRLVADLSANGGMASWDLRTFNGGQAQPGIYLIFSSSLDGSETMVGKIAILR